MRNKNKTRVNNSCRIGDMVEIPGDYQYEALYKGHAFQRAWHRQRIMAVMNNVGLDKDDVVLDVGCGSGV